MAANLVVRNAKIETIYSRVTRIIVVCPFRVAVLACVSGLVVNEPALESSKSQTTDATGAKVRTSRVRGVAHISWARQLTL